MKLRKVLALAAAAVMAVAALASCGVKEDSSNDSKAGGSSEKHYKIGIVQIMEHTSLNTIRDAVIDRLAELGYVDGKNCTIDAQQANNESTTVQQILDQFKADGDDIIIAITTPCAQLAAPYSEEIPVVFSAVTDPIGAGLCDSLDFALEMKPEIKTLGYLYNTGEDNSVSTLKEVKAYCEEKGITVIEGAASNTSEVQEAAQNLAAKCDAVFSPNDNTIAGAMGTVTEVMNKAKVPMFVGADSMVMDGGLGTVGIEYSDLGKETANMASQILSGEKKASEIPIKVFNEDLSTYINKTTADAIGITIPDDIANGEKTVYFD